MRIRLIVLSALVFIILPITVVLTNSPVPLSPIPEKKPVVEQEVAFVPSKKIIGFLPFWSLQDMEYLRYHLLSQLVFSSLQVDSDGTIRRILADKTEEPGWTAYKSQAFGTIMRKAKDAGAKMVVSVQALQPEVIDSVVNDPGNRQRLVSEITEIARQKNLDGINIDFEYSGTPSQTTIGNFTQLVKEIDVALKSQQPYLIVSVDVFADAIQKIRLWEVQTLVRDVDEVIIMAYDFHRPSSAVAGPIAPLRGSPERWTYDVIHALRDFTAIAPPEKIILGVPYYGYEWQTLSHDSYAKTYPGSGALATYKRVQSLIAKKQPILSWDEISLSPILRYEDRGKLFQVYYENEVSLGLKYDLVNESGIGGIAIWALGYDGSYPNLWNVLEEKFSP